MPTTYTLYAPQVLFRAFATLIAAKYNGVVVAVLTNISAAAKSPVGKLPLLEINNNETIFSSHAMARYMASVRCDTGLLGQSLVQAAAIDAWMDFAAQDWKLPSCVWFYPVAGYMPFLQPAYEKAKADLAKGLAQLETHLTKNSNSFLVGTQITLADIVIVSTLFYPFG